jgi:phosphoserine phosphatase
MPTTDRPDWLLPFTKAVADPVLAAVAAAQGGQRVIAAVAADGTLWRPDIGEYFLQWLSGHLPDSPDPALLPKKIWTDYAKRLKKDPADAHAFAVTALKGMPYLELLYAVDYIASEWKHYKPSMAALLEGLSEAGVEVHVVTSSWETLIRHALLYAGIDADGVFGVDVDLQHVAGTGPVMTDRLVAPVTCGSGKVEALTANLGQAPDLAIGDSLVDREMLEAARWPIVVRHRKDGDNGLATLARERGWPIQTF